MGIKLVTNKYKKEVREPEQVWANTGMDELRKSECLCLNCDRKNDKPPYNSCPIASQLYQICVEDCIALAVTRCGAVDKEGNLLYKPLN